MKYIEDEDIELVGNQANKLEKLNDYHIWRIYNPDDVTGAVESLLIYQTYELLGKSKKGGFLIATEYNCIHIVETLIAKGWRNESMDGIQRYL